MSDKQMKNSNALKAIVSVWFGIAVLVLPLTLKAQRNAVQSAADNSNARPPVTKADLEIVMRARTILDSPSKWNRADNRECPAGAKTFSLYCALEMATIEVGGKSEHRGAALQEARFVIDEIAAGRNYDHRLMGYNNDPTTTFHDIQEVFSIVEHLIALRLKAGASSALQSSWRKSQSTNDSQLSVSAHNARVDRSARSSADVNLEFHTRARARERSASITETGVAASGDRQSVHSGLAAESDR